MALELVSSDVKLSFDVPSMILTCMWTYEGRMAYSAVVCEPSLIHDPEFWHYHEVEMARWFASKHPRNGEIKCLPTFQSTLKP